MKWIYRISLFSLAFVGFYSCSDPPDYPDEPVIEFLRLNKDTVQQAMLDTDTLAITFGFTDGDGDLSFSDLSPEQDVFIRDSRNSELVTGLQIPPIPAQGIGNGISGEITLFLFNNPTLDICCNADEHPLATPCNPASFPVGATNTMHYTIQIRDKADRYSNIIRTKDIIIRCR